MIPLFLFGNISYSHKGYLDIGTIHRLSDGSIIKIPYRMLTYESVTSYRNLNLKYNSALEFRLNNVHDILNSNLKIDLRELYFEWQLPNGEISFGKQIITWGSANTNNPTDIVSPYNYYYLFSKGKEQKEGILSLNSNLYYNDMKLNFVISPFYNSHVIPLNDKEFPIGLPIEDPSTNEPLEIKNEQIMNVSKPFEYGLSIMFPIKNIDITSSFFSGYDRAFSFFGANLWTGGNSNPDGIKTDIVLSYRKTQMFGLGLSGISNNFSFNADVAYFKTNDNIQDISDSTLYRFWQSGVDEFIEDCKTYNETASWNTFFQKIDCYNEDNPVAKFNNTQLIDNRADYLQYTLELEFSPINDFMIIGQLSISDLINIGIADSIITSRETIMFDPLEFFIPGIGLSNTFISEKSFALLLQKNFQELNLEIKFSSMIDLDNKGSINELGIDYTIFKNTKLLIALNKIIYNKDINMNPFSEMENFSHIRAELKYFY